MKKGILVTLIFAIAILTTGKSTSAEQQTLAQKLSGRVLLQVQSRGEAWYVNPADKKRYYLGGPADAFGLMKDFGLGIKHNELVQHLNNGFPNKLSGKIMLDVEKNGEAYYVFPNDLGGYYLARPADAFNVMRNLSLGITNENLNKITVGAMSPSPAPVRTNCQADTAEQVFTAAAAAIRTGEKSKAVSCFIPEMQRAIEYTMNFLDSEGKLILGSIMSTATLSRSTDNQKTYYTEVYFSLGGYKVPVHFHLKKQPNGTWLLTNL